jgi:tetratricopeptide (TPR) repeat protein
MMRTHTGVFRVLLLILCLFTPLPSWAGQTPEVRQLVEQGVNCAKAQKWEEAIGFFNQARLRSPTDGSLLFNLGLACDRSGGREMWAVICYRAYLALRPGAENAPEVRKRISELKEKIKADVRMLVGKSIELTEKLPDKSKGPYSTICKVQVWLGDVEGALKTAESNPSPYPSSRVIAFGEVADALVRTGREPEALRLRERVVQAAPEKDRMELFDVLQKRIVEGKCGLKDFSGALQEASKISTKGRYYAYSWISMMQVDAGDREGALESALQVSDACSRALAFCMVANAQIEAGEMDRALKSLSKAEEALGQAAPGDYYINDVNRELCCAYASAGKLREAVQAFERITPSNNPFTAGTAEAFVCGAMSEQNLEEARKKAGRIRHDPSRSLAFLKIAESLIKRKDYVEAEKTILSIEEEMRRMHGLSRLAEAQGLLAEAEGLATQAMLVGPLDALQSMGEALERLKKEKAEEVAYQLALSGLKRVSLLKSEAFLEKVWSGKRRGPVP